MTSDLSCSSLFPLFEAVSLKNTQLQQAIRVGDDHLVRLLDRELDPLISAVLVGAIMLSAIAAAVMLLTFERRA